MRVEFNDVYISAKLSASGIYSNVIIEKGITNFSALVRYVYFHLDMCFSPRSNKII